MLKRRIQLSFEDISILLQKYSENHDFLPKSWRESCDKSVKNAPKPLKTRHLSILLNLRLGRLSGKNAYLCFLYDKFTKKKQKKRRFWASKGSARGFLEGVGETVTTPSWHRANKKFVSHWISLRPQNGNSH